METLLTVAEASALLKLSPDTIRAMIGRGQIPASRFGRGPYRIEQQALLNAMTRSEPETQKTAQSDLKRMGQELLAKMRAGKQPVKTSLHLH